MIDDRNSLDAHRQAFTHYLRTGQRLTNEEWIARQERKFNPYHDERGRFTSPPGVTVSWGKNGNASHSRAPARSRNTSANAAAGSIDTAVANGQGGDRSSSTFSKTPPAELRSEFIRNATTEGGPSETYFELNKRQAGLNRLRQAAIANPEKNPDDAKKVKDDLDQLQGRLDAARARLDARQPEINAQTNEVLRAGLAAFDVGAGVLNVASGKGQVRDYLSVVGVIPVGAAVRRINGIVQLGGAQSVVKRLISAENLVGLEKNHIPSLASWKIAKIQIRPSRKPVLAMVKEHHEATPSWGNSRESSQFHEAVAKLLERGKLEEALEMEARGLEKKIKDASYDWGMEDLIKYTLDNFPHLKR